MSNMKRMTDGITLAARFRICMASLPPSKSVFAS